MLSRLGKKKSSTSSLNTQNNEKLRQAMMKEANEELESERLKSHPNMAKIKGLQEVHSEWYSGRLEYIYSTTKQISGYSQVAILKLSSNGARPCSAAADDRWAASRLTTLARGLPRLATADSCSSAHWDMTCSRLPRAAAPCPVLVKMTRVSQTAEHKPTAACQAGTVDDESSVTACPDLPSPLLTRARSFRSYFRASDSVAFDSVPLFDREPTDLPAEQLIRSYEYTERDSGAVDSLGRPHLGRIDTAVGSPGESSAGSSPSAAADWKKRHPNDHIAKRNISAPLHKAPSDGSDSPKGTPPRSRADTGKSSDSAGSLLGRGTPLPTPSAGHTPLLDRFPVPPGRHRLDSRQGPLTAESLARIPREGYFDGALPSPIDGRFPRRVDSPLQARLDSSLQSPYFQDSFAPRSVPAPTTASSESSLVSPGFRRQDSFPSPSKLSKTESQEILERARQSLQSDSSKGSGEKRKLSSASSSLLSGSRKNSSNLLVRVGETFSLKAADKSFIHGEPSKGRKYSSDDASRSDPDSRPLSPAFGFSLPQGLPKTPSAEPKDKKGKKKERRLSEDGRDKTPKQPSKFDTRIDPECGCYPGLCSFLCGMSFDEDQKPHARVCQPHVVALVRKLTDTTLPADGMVRGSRRDTTPAGNAPNQARLLGSSTGAGRPVDENARPTAVPGDIQPGHRKALSILTGHAELSGAKTTNRLKKKPTLPGAVPALTPISLAPPIAPVYRDSGFEDDDASRASAGQVANAASVPVPEWLTKMNAEKELAIKAVVDEFSAEVTEIVTLLDGGNIEEKDGQNYLNDLNQNQQKKLDQISREFAQREKDLWALQPKPVSAMTKEITAQVHKLALHKQARSKMLLSQLDSVTRTYVKDASTGIAVPFPTVSDEDLEMMVPFPVRTFTGKLPATPTWKAAGFTSHAEWAKANSEVSFLHPVDPYFEQDPPSQNPFPRSANRAACPLRRRTLNAELALLSEEWIRHFSSYTPKSDRHSVEFTLEMMEAMLHHAATLAFLATERVVEHNIRNRTDESYDFHLGDLFPFYTRPPRMASLADGVKEWDEVLRLFQQDFNHWMLTGSLCAAEAFKYALGQYVAIISGLRDQARAADDGGWRAMDNPERVRVEVSGARREKVRLATWAGQAEGLKAMEAMRLRVQEAGEAYWNNPESGTVVFKGQVIPAGKSEFDWD